MNITYKPPGSQYSAPPEKSGNFAKTLTIVLLLAFLAAGGLHLYRNGGLPGLQNPLATLHSAAPQNPGTSAQRGGGSFLQQLGGLLPGSWSRQEFSEFSLEAPFVLSSHEPPNKGLSDFQLHQITQRFRWQGVSLDGFLVVADYMASDGSHPLSMEDGVKGSIRTLATHMGDSAPAFRSVSTFVNGLPARRISYEHEHDGKNWHMESLLVQANRKVISVSTLFPGEARMGDAQRVLNSLYIHLGN